MFIAIGTSPSNADNNVTGHVLLDSAKMRNTPNTRDSEEPGQNAPI